MEKSKMNKFYLTTPIYYANDVPHIGHIGTTIYADILARYYRQSGFDVLFLTGLDEHGEKVAIAAQKDGKNPQEFVDRLAQKWQNYWKELNISYDFFMRTTFDGHKKVAQELLNQLKNKGDIYKSTYKGIYCVGCEEFKSEKDLVKGICPEHRPDQISYKEEENYFFKLSKYIPTIRQYLEDGTIPLGPETKRKEILARLDDEIHDLSISRQNVDWGVRIPWDKNQTVYVWVEALMNYYSATKILHKEEFWPAGLHLLGKGNNWFHSVIWPAFLIALDIPLPKKIFVHGYYTKDGQKIGKSLGNALSVEDLVDKYGLEGTRYLLGATIPYNNDADVTNKLLDEKYNSDLANGLGNLVARVAKLCEKNGIEITYKPTNFDDELKLLFEELKFYEVIEHIRSKITEADKKINDEKPWELKPEEAKEILEDLAKRILQIAFNLKPFLPKTSDRILDQFSGKVKTRDPLFPRIN